MTANRVAAVTGASGYLGSRVCEVLEGRGWNVVELVRQPRARTRAAVAYDLAAPLSDDAIEVVRAADVVVHAAYDLTLTEASDIWRVNVDGSRRLLGHAAHGATRPLVFSSMSAFHGTTQLYGRAKLDIEAATIAAEGCALRPGVVLGAGGMAAALRRLTRLPVVPVISGGAGVYTVSEPDLMATVARLAEANAPAGRISVADPEPVPLRDLLARFAEEEGRRCHFVAVPWRLVYGMLRLAERAHVAVPFRADSVLALAHTPPRPDDAGKVVDLDERGATRLASNRAFFR